MADRSKKVKSPKPFQQPQEFAAAVLERALAEKGLGEITITGYVTAYALAMTFDAARRGRLMGPRGNQRDLHSISGKSFADEFTKSAYQIASQNGNVALDHYRPDHPQMEILADTIGAVFDQHQEALKAQRRT